MESFFQTIIDAYKATTPEDYAANGVFFLLDLVLIAILLPFAISFYDNLKWRKARRFIWSYSREHMDELNSLFIDLRWKFTTLSEQLEKAQHGETMQPVLSAYDFLSEEYINKYQDVNKFRAESFANKMAMLSPSFNSDYSVAYIEFYDACTYAQHNAEYLLLSIRSSLSEVINVIYDTKSEVMSGPIRTLESIERSEKTIELNLTKLGKLSGIKKSKWKYCLLHENGKVMVDFLDKAYFRNP